MKKAAVKKMIILVKMACILAFVAGIFINAFNASKEPSITTNVIAAQTDKRDISISDSQVTIPMEMVIPVNWTGNGSKYNPYIVSMGGVFNSTVITLKSRADFIVIKDCRLRGNLTSTVPAIELYDCSNVLIENVSIAGFKDGIYLVRCHNVTINSAIVGDCAVGIHIKGSSAIDIEETIISRTSQRGIHVEDASCDVGIKHCKIRGNPQGIAITESLDVVVYNNSISRATHGVYLEFGHGNTIEANVISFIEIGIKLSLSHDNTIIDNTITGLAGSGVDLLTSNGNEVIGNDIRPDGDGMPRVSDTGGMANEIARNGDDRDSIKDLIDPIMTFSVILTCILLVSVLLFKAGSLIADTVRSGRSPTTIAAWFYRWTKRYKIDYSLDEHSFVITSVIRRPRRSAKSVSMTFAGILGLLAFTVEVLFQTSSSSTPSAQVATITAIG